MFVTLDFSNLHERECEGEDHPDDSDSDFETWSPKDAPTGEQCLLGEKVVYIRRKADAKCYFSSEYEPQPSELHSCACTDEDYTWFASYGAQTLEKHYPLAVDVLSCAFYNLAHAHSGRVCAMRFLLSYLCRRDLCGRVCVFPVSGFCAVVS